MSRKSEIREQVTIRLSKALVELWSSLPEESLEDELEETIVLSFVAQHRISASRGAELLGVPYRDFLARMYERGIPLFDYENGEVEADHKALSQVLGGR
jgi:predicted HTH domain antitoxin